MIFALAKSRAKTTPNKVNKKIRGYGDQKKNDIKKTGTATKKYGKFLIFTLNFALKIYKIRRPF